MFSNCLENIFGTLLFVHIPDILFRGLFPLGKLSFIMIGSLPLASKYWCVPDTIDVSVAKAHYNPSLH